MTDYGTVVDHADAVMDRLYAQMPADIEVYPAAAGGPSVVPPGAIPPYVSVHISGSPDNGGRLNLLSTRFTQRAYVHCVGANDEAARIVLDYVNAALVDYRPEIPGRSVYPIRAEPPREPFVAEPVAQSTVEITGVYRLESEPGRQSS